MEAATRWFDVDIASDPRLRVHVMDARRFLPRDRGTYDLVQLDVYQGGPYVPFHLVTEECFRLARARMSDDALLMMNVFDRGAGHGAAADGWRPRSAACSRPSWSARPTPATSCCSRSRASRPRSGSRYRSPALRSNAGACATCRSARSPVADGTPVFTDDLAPIEEMTRQMLAVR